MKTPLRNGAKFLEMNSHNTVDSIFDRQNDAFLLQCQVAQRNEYSKAKSLARRKAVFTLAFATLSVVSSVLDIDWLSAVSSFLAVTLALYNKHSDEEIKGMKKRAASIQQYIDVAIFAPTIGTNVSDWGDIPSKSDLAESVSEYRNADVSAFLNWYSDYSSMSGEAQVFYCQKENVRWDYALHKGYRKLVVVLLCVVSLVVLGAFVMVNPSFVNAFWVASWFLPVAEYSLSIIKEVNESISVLRDANNFAKTLEEKLNASSSRTLKKEIIKLQHKIWNRRANGYLIPDWFYEFHKKTRQEKEDNIARTIQNLDK